MIAFHYFPKHLISVNLKKLFRIVGICKTYQQIWFYSKSYRARVRTVLGKTVRNLVSRVLITCPTLTPTTSLITMPFFFFPPLCPPITFAQMFVWFCYTICMFLFIYFLFSVNMYMLLLGE